MQLFEEYRKSMSTLDETLHARIAAPPAAATAAADPFGPSDLRDDLLLAASGGAADGHTGRLERESSSGHHVTFADTPPATAGHSGPLRSGPVPVGGPLQAGQLAQAFAGLQSGDGSIGSAGGSLGRRQGGGGLQRSGLSRNISTASLAAMDLASDPDIWRVRFPVCAPGWAPVCAPVCAPVYALFVARDSKCA